MCTCEFIAIYVQLIHMQTCFSLYLFIIILAPLSTYAVPPVRDCQTCMWQCQSIQNICVYVINFPLAKERYNYDAVHCKSYLTHLNEPMVYDPGSHDILCIIFSDNNGQVCAQISILFMYECDFKRSSIMAIFNLMPMQSTQWSQCVLCILAFYVLKSSIAFSMRFTHTHTHKHIHSYRCTSLNFICWIIIRSHEI